MSGGWPARVMRRAFFLFAFRRLGWQRIIVVVGKRALEFRLY